MWKSSTGIYALKTSGGRVEGGGMGGEKLRLTCFHCGIIMMMKSLLQSSSKQWYVHSCGDGQSTGCCLLSLFTIPPAYNDDSQSHY